MHNFDNIILFTIILFLIFYPIVIYKIIKKRVKLKLNKQILTEEKKQANCKKEVLVSDLEKDILKINIDKMNQNIKDKGNNTKVYEPVPKEDKKQVVKYHEPVKERVQPIKPNNGPPVLKVKEVPQKVETLKSNLEKESLKDRIDKMNQIIKDKARNTKVYEPVPKEDKKQVIKYSEFKMTYTDKPLLISDEIWEVIVDLRKNITGALSGVDINLLTKEQKIEFAKMGWREKICVFPELGIDSWKLKILKNEMFYTNSKPTKMFYTNSKPTEIKTPSYSYDHWVNGHWVTRNGTTYWRSGHSRSR